MKVSADALMATIRGAVAEQRAATLAFDGARLSAANTRLEKALGSAQSAFAQPDSDVAAAAKISPQAKEIQRDLSANSTLMQGAQLANQRALNGLLPATVTAPVYGADGATHAVQQIRPIGLA